MTQARNDQLDRILSEARPEIAAHWESCRESGLEAATQAATDQVDACITAYFADLKALPDGAVDERVLATMQRLYAGLDAVNASAQHGLLETDERELLVPIFIAAAEAMGVDAEKYDGEPGGEFRDF
jgi:hypothetical protein